MVGPSPKMQGGVASVVNGYIDGGLGRLCNLSYIATACDGPRARKALVFASACLRFYRKVRATDVVHIHMSMRASFERKYLLARIAKENGKRIVAHVHDGEFAALYESASDAYRRRVREFFGWVDVVIVLSVEWRNYFSANVCDAEKIVVMHNAVALPDVPAEPIAHRNVLFLGRLGANKSPDVLLKAAKALRARFPEVRYRFGGDGDVVKYRVLAEELGVADVCDFVGWVTGEEKECLVRESGVFCLPSRHEGMPMSMLEMMAYGLPCVMTPVGGIPQVIRNGVNGYTFPVCDAGALASLLEGLFNSRGLRCKIGNAARKTIAEEFNIHTNIKKLEELYAKL